MLKKIIWGTIGGLVAVVAIAVALLGTQVDRVVADALETYGSAATHTAVDAAGVAIALTQGKGTVDRLTIGNPDGYSTDYAVRIADTELTLDLASLSGSVPVVTELLLTGAHVNAEQRGDATNLTDIQELMSSADGSPQGTTEGRIVIERFRLTNATVTLTSELLSKPEELALGDVIVEGIGRGTGGATYSDAAAAVLAPIMAAAKAAVQARLRSAAADAARDELEEEAGEKLRELLDR
jgi:hypothetical protein